MPRKKRPKLTPRQQKLVKHLAKGKTHAEAAIAAGYSPKNPRQSAANALEAIRHTLPDILAECGLDDVSVVKNHLHPLMNAKETKYFSLPVGRGKTRTLQIHTREQKNWTARANGLDIWSKIRGAYVREAENKGPEFSVIIINAAHRPDWSKMRATKPIDVPPPADDNGHDKGNGNGH